MELLLFGIAKDIVGESVISLTDRDTLPASVAELKQWLAADYPDFSQLSSLAIAVNSEYADDDLALKENDEIAIIPPVSGG